LNEFGVGGRVDDIPIAMLESGGSVPRYVRT